MKRSAVFLLAVVAAAGLVLPVGAQEPDAVNVYLITVDSLHPSQVGPDTPTLQSLKDTGTWYEQHRAVMASETLPNHVAMGTGTYPGVNGIPGNGGRANVGDNTEADPDLGDPANLQATSFIAAIEAQCPDLRTVTSYSKEYVWRVFDGLNGGESDADFPQSNFNIPGSGHAPDTSTVGFMMSELENEVPAAIFANLGDVDRAGHIDVSGASGFPAEQRAALQQTDSLLQTFVGRLQSLGVWEDTVLIIASDHSMDWSVPIDPSTAVNVAGALEADPATAGRFFVSENGGAALVYLQDPDAADADQLLAQARATITALDGIAEALYREPNALDPGNDLASVHPEWNLHQTPRAGEIFAYTEPGKKIGSQSSNPIPGNHGHVVTRHATMLVSGGWDGVVAQSIPASDPDAIDLASDTTVLTEQSEQVDIAPTIGWLMGIADPGLAAGGAAQWQGRVLTEAFSRQPAPACAAPAVAPSPTPAPSPSPAVGADQTPNMPATGGGLALLGFLALLTAGLVRGRDEAA